MDQVDPGWGGRKNEQIEVGSQASLVLKGWDRGRWMGHPQGDMHMVAARLGCQSAIVRTRWANSCPAWLHGQA